MRMVWARRRSLSSSAGSTTLTATSVSNPAISGSATFTVASAAAKTFTIPTAPATQTAGTAFTLGIGATDTYGNPFGGTVTTAGTACPSAARPTRRHHRTPPRRTRLLTFTNGAATASITLYDAQSTTLTVGATGVTSGKHSDHGDRWRRSKFTLSTPTARPLGRRSRRPSLQSTASPTRRRASPAPSASPSRARPTRPTGTAPIYPAGAAAPTDLVDLPQRRRHGRNHLDLRRPDHGADRDPGPRHGYLGHLHGEPGSGARR